VRRGKVLSFMLHPLSAQNARGFNTAGELVQLALQVIQFLFEFVDARLGFPILDPGKAALQ